MQTQYTGYPLSLKKTNFYKVASSTGLNFVLLHAMCFLLILSDPNLEIYSIKNEVLLHLTKISIRPYEI